MAGPSETFVPSGANDLLRFLSSEDIDHLLEYLLQPRLGARALPTVVSKQATMSDSLVVASKNPETVESVLWWQVHTPVLIQHKRVLSYPSNHRKRWLIRKRTTEDQGSYDCVLMGAVSHSVALGGADLSRIRHQNGDDPKFVRATLNVQHATCHVVPVVQPRAAD